MVLIFDAETNIVLDSHVLEMFYAFNYKQRDWISYHPNQHTSENGKEP